jgi:hypothetical protein
MHGGEESQAFVQAGGRLCAGQTITASARGMFNLFGLSMGTGNLK